MDRTSQSLSVAAATGPSRHQGAEVVERAKGVERAERLRARSGGGQAGQERVMQQGNASGDQAGQRRARCLNLPGPPHYLAFEVARGSTP